MLSETYVIYSLLHEGLPSITFSQPAEDNQNLHKLVRIKGFHKQCGDIYPLEGLQELGHGSEIKQELS